MRKMTVFLGVLAAVCAFGWLNSEVKKMKFFLGMLVAVCAFDWCNSWVARGTLIKYMTDKNTLLSDEMIKACLKGILLRL